MQVIKNLLHNAFVLKKAYDAQWDDVMTRHGLTRAEIEVVAFLSNAPDMDTAHEIVEYLMIAKSHVSKAVDSLIARGFLTREKDPDDRRCLHLTLTEKSAALVREIKEKQEAFAETITAGISEEELKQFTETAARVAENAKNG